MLQNGLGVEEEVTAFASHSTILGGLCFICSGKVGPGHIRHLDYGRFSLGEYSTSPCGAGITPVIENIANDFEKAGITVTPVDNLAVARWKKLVWNIPFNGLSVLLDATTEELVRHPQTKELARQLMQEVTAGAGVCGYPVEEDFVIEMLHATDTMIPYAPSMKLDYDAKRPLELESIYARPLRKAEDAGVAMP